MRRFICLICIMMTLILYGSVYIKSLKTQEMSAPKYTVGVVLKAMDSEHWLAVQSSMQKIAKSNNINLIVLYPKNEADYQAQNKMIIDLLKNDVDAIIVSPCNIYKAQEYLALAKQKQIPIFTLDENIKDIPYIGSDNYRIGERAAEYLDKRLPKEAQVSILSGSAVQEAHIKRVQGFVDYINKNTDLVINNYIVNDINYRQATLQTEHLLKQYPDTQGLFVTNAVMTLGAIEAIDETDKQITIIGVDTQNDAIMAIKNKKIDAMISQDGYEIGALAMNIVLDYLINDRQPQKDNYIENNFITIENADNYLLQEDF